jgi:hypothetical protein
LNSHASWVDPSVGTIKLQPEGHLHTHSRVQARGKLPDTHDQQNKGHTSTVNHLFSKLFANARRERQLEASILIRLSHSRVHRPPGEALLSRILGPVRINRNAFISVLKNKNAPIKQHFVHEYTVAHIQLHTLMTSSLGRKHAHTNGCMYATCTRNVMRIEMTFHRAGVPARAGGYNSHAKDALLCGEVLHSSMFGVLNFLKLALLLIQRLLCAFDNILQLCKLLLINLSSIRDTQVLFGL